MLSYYNNEENSLHPIAKVIDLNDYTKNKYLYLNENVQDYKPINSIKTLINENDYTKNNGRTLLSTQLQKMLNKALEEDISIDEMPEDLRPMYSKLKSKQQKHLGKEMILKSGELFVPYPSKGPSRRLVSGHSGLGKSFLMSYYASLYLKLFPENQVFLFTVHEDDPAYRGLNIQTVLVTDEIIEMDLELENFRDSLVLIDDCDHIADRQLFKYMEGFKNDLLTNSRKYDVQLYISSHLLCNGFNTKVVLSEVQFITFFLSGTSSYSISRLLKIYLGFTKQQIEKILNLKSRWVMLSITGMHLYVLTENCCYII